jgi:hypothetical protein
MQWCSKNSRPFGKIKLNLQICHEQQIINKSQIDEMCKNLSYCTNLQINQKDIRNERNLFLKSKRI